MKCDTGSDKLQVQIQMVSWKQFFQSTLLYWTLSFYTGSWGNRFQETYGSRTSWEDTRKKDVIFQNAAFDSKCRIFYMVTFKFLEPMRFKTYLGNCTNQNQHQNLKNHIWKYFKLVFPYWRKYFIYPFLGTK